jgi:hypothetical protein
MKRFILCSLSLAIPFALGSVARAGMQSGSMEAEISDRLAQATSPTDGIIVPNDDGPSNRVVPDGNAVEPSEEMELEPSTTRGIISPNDDGPYNRVVPQGGAVEPMDDEGVVSPPSGVIAPNDDGPSNRVEPGY